MSEQDAIGKAQAAVGSDDQVVAAAWLLPRGFSAGIGMGGAAGGGLGGAAGSGLGKLVGGTTGALLGESAAQRHDSKKLQQTSGGDGKVPANALVAVSGSTLYCWVAVLDGMHRAAGDVVFVLPRAQAKVTVHQRVSVQTFEVVDESTGATYEFESPRLNGHLGPVVEALAL